MSTDQTTAPNTVAHISAINSQGVPDYESAWVLSEEQVVYYTRQFCRMQPDLFSFVDAIAARNFFSQSQLDTSCLSEIWDLSDVNNDGVLSLDEFCIAMHLSVGRRHGLAVPQKLPNVLMKVAGEVNRIVAIFSKYGNNSSNQQPDTKVAVGSHIGHPNSSGFDDDFGSHVMSSAGDSSRITSNQQQQQPFSAAFSHQPHHTSNDLFNHQNALQQTTQPTVPPRSDITDSPSNPPPSHPPPALRNVPPSATGAQNQTSISGFATSGEISKSTPLAPPRANLQPPTTGNFGPVPGTVGTISADIDPNVVISKSNAQLIKELKDLVTHRNLLDQQIESLQNILRSEARTASQAKANSTTLSGKVADGSSKVPSSEAAPRPSTKSANS